MKPKAAAGLDEHAAATKIQAAHRGRKGRGRVKKVLNRPIGLRSDVFETDSEDEER